MDGTIFSKRATQFITDIKITLTRSSDRKTHDFIWWVFRDINHLDNSKTKFETSSAFVVKDNDDKRINIVFCDEVTKQKYMDDVLEIRNSFQNFLSTNGRMVSSTCDIKSKIDLLLPEFRIENKDAITSAYSKMSKIFYWEAGSYEVEMFVSTRKPKKVFRSRYKFSLTEAESKKLEINVVGLIEAALHQPHLPNFANPTVVKISD